MEMNRYILSSAGPDRGGLSRMDEEWEMVKLVKRQKIENKTNSAIPHADMSRATIALLRPRFQR